MAISWYGHKANIRRYVWHTAILYFAVSLAAPITSSNAVLKPHSWTSIVVAHEFDAGRFQS
jgi:hypothetical protein